MLKSFPFATWKSLRKLLLSLSCFTDEYAEIEEGQISLPKVTQVLSGRGEIQPQIILTKAHVPFSISLIPEISEVT